VEKDGGEAAVMAMVCGGRAHYGGVGGGAPGWEREQQRAPFFSSLAATVGIAGLAGLLVLHQNARQPGPPWSL
jgi:hypothetical protein